MRIGAFFVCFFWASVYSSAAGAEERHASGVGMGSLEYDSNVLENPETSISAPSGRSDFSDFAFLWGATSVPRVPLTIRVYFLSKDYWKFHNLDLLGASAALEHQGMFSGGRWSLGYGYQHFDLNRDSFLGMHFLEAKMRWDHGLPDLLDVSYKFSYKTFIPGQFAFLTGRQHEWKAAYRFRNEPWWSNWEVRAGLLWEDAGRSDAAYWGGSLEPEWKPHLPGGVEIGLSPMVRCRYYGKNVQPGPRRRDWLQGYSARMSRLFGRHFLPEIEFRWERNGSTLDSFTYHKSLVTASATAVF